MNIVQIDLFDGSFIEAVVKDGIAASRLRKFCIEAGVAFNDKERWEKMRRLMTHERCGPNLGWTLGVLLPGEDQDEAIDNAKEPE